MRIHQWKQKLPISLFFIAVGAGVITFGILNPERQSRSSWMPSETVFMGTIGIAWAVIFFLFGTIDWSTWNSIKGRFGSNPPEPPIEIEEPEESAEKAGFEGLPTTFLGWGSALIAACALIWYLVRFMTEFVGALLR